MDNYQDYTVHDFLDNESFIGWVQNPTSETIHFWDDFLKKYPQKTHEFTKSKTIVKYFMPMDKELSALEIDEIWNNINKSTVSRKNKTLKFRYAMAAASVVAFLVASSVFFIQYKHRNQEINYASIKTLVPVSDDIKLCLADSTEVNIKQTETEIKYDANGRLIVNSQIISTKRISSNAELEFNQLIVPRGKRSSILFADGTKLWLNSGSRAIYPVEFKTDKREIFIEGEAYLEVSHDELRPFVVKTEKLDVKVLGTSFNISAYPEDKTANVVLVKGSVKASFKNHQEQLLLPNQMVSYNARTNKVNLDEVDIFEHISWKEGWLLCHSERLETVFSKLSRYYDRQVVFADEKAKAFQLSGKLDLKDNIGQVLKIISSTAPVKAEENNNLIIITSK